MAAPCASGSASVCKAPCLALLLTCCAAWIAVVAQAVSLPAPTPFYYTAVSAGFGPLLFSLHYEEYGNSTAEYTRSIGRYYSPTTLEWTDAINDVYMLDLNAAFSCLIYPVPSGRVTLGATAVLDGLASANAPFRNVGVTTQVRSQPSVRFSASQSWTQGTAGMFSIVDTLIQQAYATAGVSTSNSYSVQAGIDVYYVSDAAGNLKTAGPGYIPLQFTITGTRTDNTYGSMSLNIEYDFMNFANLQTSIYWQVQNIDFWLSEARYYCYAADAGSVPPALPTSPSALGAVNSTLPYWDGGRAILEITASNHAALQYDAQLRPQHGQELLVALADPNEYSWYTLLYAYDFPNIQNFQYANGAVYTLNGTDSKYYYEYWDNAPVQFCTGEKMSPGNISPLQWLNAGSLNSFFANPSFLNGLQFSGIGGRSTIRGITTDKWTITKGMAYNGAAYNFTISIYVTAPGWSNLGRSMASLAPQLVRLSYSGTKFPARDQPSPYTMAIDFFVQHSVAWRQETYNLNPQDHYGCPVVSDGAPMMPQLPPQYTVTVSESWVEDFYTAQYTMYVDSTTGRRRIDGLFVGPQTISIVSPSRQGSDYLQILEWTQNVTLTGGFSAQTLSNGLSYTLYAQDQMSSCSPPLTVLASDFAASAALNFFDWLGQADATLATYVASANQRGMDVDIYEVAMNGASGSANSYYSVTDFQVSFLASDETSIPNIPVRADVSYAGSYFNEPFYFPGYWNKKAVYHFYNFRSTVPKGIFNTPSTATMAATCNDPPQVPAPIHHENYIYSVPDPFLDGTPMKAPVFPSSFSLLVEGQLFASSGDNTIYTARWYTDFANFRERLDIEPAFNVPGAPRITAVTGTYLYYYTPTGTSSFSYTGGTYVTYNGVKCSAMPITSANMNPLKRVPPGSLFDTFFPDTTQSISSQSAFIETPRLNYLRFDGILYDDYQWNFHTWFNGQEYQGLQSLYISMQEWVINAQAVNRSMLHLPLSIQTTAWIGQFGTGTQYNPQFRTTFYQPGNPGTALFDAALFGCATTPTSPWYNIYGTFPSSSSSSSLSSGAIAGVAIGVIVGVLIVLAVTYCWWKRGKGQGTGLPKVSFGSGARSNGANGHEKSNEMGTMGAKRLTDEPEHSLNRENAEVEETGVVIHDNDSAPATTDGH